MQLQLGQHHMGVTVSRLPPGLLQQELPLVLHVRRVEEAHIPEHILNALHAGLVREGKELVDAHPEIGGELRQHGDLRGRHARFP